jgi:hypothetical protein
MQTIHNGHTKTMSFLDHAPRGLITGPVLPSPAETNETADETTDNEPGTVQAKAKILCGLNEVIKQEARRRGITAADLAGIWLAEKVNAHLQLHRIQQQERLRGMFGNDWREQLQGLFE